MSNQCDNATNVPTTRAGCFEVRLVSTNGMVDDVMATFGAWLTQLPPHLKL
jgi:hypothetical protein